MRTLMTVAALASLAGGCATSAGHPAGSEAAGRAFVQRACAGCHAITPTGASPNPAAPPFRTLAGRLPGRALQQRLRGIAQGGHGEMPPIYMTPAEIRAAAAYVRSVAAPGAGLRTAT